MSGSSVKEVIYRHVSLKGTSYEIGKKEAEIMEEYYPEEVIFYRKGNDLIKPVSIERIKEAIKLFDKFCPNINEEINGFADYFGCSPEEIIYYSFSCVSKGNCGQFSVLPQKTADKNIYVGRSYEWNDEDDKKLLTVKADGLYGHMGFSLLLFGRYDGINEKGLCVTMSNGLPGKMSEEEGLRFWMVVRILLDQCKDVDESIELIKTIPISSYCNLIITDKNASAVLVEISNAVKSFQRISSTSAQGYVCSTNHYTLPEMKRLVKNRMKQSVDRYNSIVDNLKVEIVDKKTLKNILSQHMPNGLACHYYQDGLGTLWSILFDVTNIQADICFGSPLANDWHTFDLSSTEGINSYKAFLPNEESTPQTWMQV
jgi:predicted choloylglycine hydrolase